MKLYAPSYYQEFVCVASKCKHSCCIGWEIDIDEASLSKYDSLSAKYGNEIRESIDYSSTPHFKLTENERCAHLDCNGLCKIIRSVGEEYLCDICREHPRFYNFTNYGKEVGLGISCEEACRIIMNSDDYDKFYVVGETDGILDVCDFDALEHRQCIYKILKDSSLGFDEKINAILSRYDLDISTFDFNEVFSLLEYLDEGHREIFSNGKINHRIPDPDKLIRLLAYFIYRHCSEAVDKEEFKASLGLSIILTYLTESISCDNIEEIARVVSEEIEYSENNTDSIKEMFY